MRNSPVPIQLCTLTALHWSGIPISYATIALCAWENTFMCYLSGIHSGASAHRGQRLVKPPMIFNNTNDSWWSGSWWGPVFWWIIIPHRLERGRLERAGRQRGMLEAMLAAVGCPQRSHPLTVLTNWNAAFSWVYQGPAAFFMEAP